MNKENPLLKSNHDLGQIAQRSGFKFRDIENRNLDWRTMGEYANGSVFHGLRLKLALAGSVDVNKIVENQDFDFLEKIIPKIIEAPMQSVLNTAILDPSVYNLFRLAQLGLQYLSFCHQFMDRTLFDLRTAMYQLQKVRGWAGLEG